MFILDCFSVKYLNYFLICSECYLSMIHRFYETIIFGYPSLLHFLYAKLIFVNHDHTEVDVRAGKE